MTFENITLFSSVCLAAMASPGPAVIGVISRALAMGWRRNVSFIAGIVCGDLIVLLLVMFGMAAVADRFADIVAAIRILGGGYLIWLGIKILIARPDNARFEEKGGKDGLSALIGGCVLTLSNPKAIMFYVAIVPLVLDLQHITPSDFLIVSLIIIVLLSSVLTAYSLGSSGARRFFTNPVHRRRIDCVVAIILMLAGVAVWFE